MQIDLDSGTPLTGSEGFTEYFRLRHGQVEETQYSLVSHEVAANGLGDDEAYLRDPYAGDRGYFGSSPYGGGFGDFFRNGLFGGLFGQPQRPVPPPNAGRYGDLRPRSSEDRRWFPPRQIDPDVPWRDRQRSEY